MRAKSTTQRWRETEALIIDEISMVNAHLLDLVDNIARKVRRSSKPFGGIQVIVSGDFFQLPPVPDVEGVRAKSSDLSFAFEAECWDTLFPEAYKLVKIFRQKDPKLISVLNEMRIGELSDTSIALLNTLSREMDFPDGIKPTEIYPYRHLVERANNDRMARLASEGRLFMAEDKAGVDAFGIRISQMEARKMLETRVPESLTLRTDAQVMCVQNISESNLMNGSIGRVLGFLTAKEAVEQGYPVAGAPVKLSDKGVAERVSVSPKYMNLEWPLVRFTNGGEFLMLPSDFVLENAVGEMRARRRQVPLILAWALTIHKAQGQTIDRLKVDLGRTFAPGQAYVAVSRCRTLEGLQLMNFTPKSVFVDPRVVEWDKKLILAPIEGARTKGH
ncbi:hypothetical protein CTheo_8037 [Ceratobasidium theobromae]|uniref:ATP-dependent DNA helicase n=1 Tax=Ceratobasidium theobromae TaxID=1582974 RepID=A0A5N5QA70_9AGAM|nr:hypothetical protein CTheo_8037 [Ceratobasidium theobromae]